LSDHPKRNEETETNLEIRINEIKVKGMEVNGDGDDKLNILQHKGQLCAPLHTKNIDQRKGYKYRIKYTNEILIKHTNNKSVRKKFV
jgi:hypothetical protein